MPPTIALILCVVMVTVLLRIERKRNPFASHALWIPTFWMLLCGSKPIGKWFASSLSSFGGDEAGSLPDRLVLGLLILLSLLVLFRRKIEWSRILKDNFWLIFLYFYLGVSILWSDHPFVSLRRWIRISGAIPIAMIVLSERSPLKALESTFRRCAYVLVPLSFMLIKYFPDLGRQYNRWDGQLMWTGMATQKNGLGALCAFSVFFIIWAFLQKRRAGGFSKTRSQTLADGLVFAIAVFLLMGPGGSYSATSIAVLIIGIFIMLILYWKESFAKWISVYLKAVVVALPLLYLLFSASLLPTVLSILDRDATLTGRTAIWSAVLDVASRKPLLGNGYGGYWGLEDEITSAVGVSQAHNGYLGVYLDVGIVGIVLLFAFLMAFCGKVRREINLAFDWGVLGVCFLMMILIYSYVEGSLLKTSFFWSIMVFLTVVFSERNLPSNED